jgi:hypothetical protein
LQIGVDELIAFKIRINQAIKHYNLAPLTATMRLIDDIKNIIKLMGLYLRKFAINEACSRKSKPLVTLAEKSWNNRR